MARTSIRSPAATTWCDHSRLALASVFQARAACDGVFHARAGVEKQHDTHRAVAAKVKALAEQPRPGQRQRDQGDQEDPQSQQQQVTQPQLTGYGSVPLLQEAE